MRVVFVPNTQALKYLGCQFSTLDSPGNENLCNYIRFGNLGQLSIARKQPALKKRFSLQAVASNVYDVGESLLQRYGA